MKPFLSGGKYPRPRIKSTPGTNAFLKTGGYENHIGIVLMEALHLSLVHHGMDDVMAKVLVI
jgi:hypothetical protein